MPSMGHKPLPPTPSNRLTTSWPGRRKRFMPRWHGPLSWCFLSSEYLPRGTCCNALLYRNWIRLRDGYSPFFYFCFTRFFRAFFCLLASSLVMPAGGPFVDGSSSRLAISTCVFERDRGASGVRGFVPGGTATVSEYCGDLPFRRLTLLKKCAARLLPNCPKCHEGPFTNF